MSDSKPVAVRLSSDHRHRLESLAAKRGMKPSEYLREVLVAHFNSGNDENMSDAVEAMRDEQQRIREELSRLRRDIALTLETVMVNLIDGDDATILRFIDEHLRGKTPMD